ncbi:MAG: hypothetical protein MUO59_04405, partial [Actinobacteria bacterium]|nr:hypothetical protein [Actinomycetota bacterium]
IYISGIEDPALINWIIMVMMILDSSFFALFAYLVDKGKISVYIILIIFLFINTILTITDQIGIFDWIVLFMNLASMIPAIFLMRRLIRGTTKSF